MPLYNQLKEYRSKLGINQTDLGKWRGYRDRPSA